MRLHIAKTSLIAIMSIIMFTPDIATSQTLFALDNYRIPVEIKSASIGKVYNLTYNRPY
jgi:hypothetical protein